MFLRGICGFLLFFFLLQSPVTSLARLHISEVAPWNSGNIQDEDGTYPGWIEMYHSGTAPINLEGWSFSTVKGEKSWVFPSVTIQPGTFILVFASGKNRRNPTSPLHTSFVLEDRVSYLALLRPNHSTESELRLPRLPAEVSYGLEVGTNLTRFVHPGSSVKMLIPSSDIGLQWTQKDFDDSSWSSVVNGIGYETNVSAAAFGIIADSMDDFSGVQGQAGWYYGYYFKTADVDRTYHASKFTPFPNEPGPFGPLNYWTGEYWDWWPADPPWTTIRRTVVHPNSGIEHWAIRRWKSDRSATVLIRMKVGMAGGAGDGTTTLVYLNGQRVFWRGLFGTDRQGFDETLELDIKKDDLIDFVNSPDGRAVSTIANDGYDTTADHYRIEGHVHLKSAYQTDVQAAMHGKNSSVYLRYPFDVESVPQPLSFQLKVKHDAGFVAYLNGTEVARRLAGVQPVAAALQAHSANDFSGTQGGKNWLYGYYIKSADADGEYQPEDFVPFSSSDYAGERWAIGPGDPPWTEITRDGGHPNGGNNGSVHWAIRRWRSPISGNLSVEWIHRKGNFLGGNGTSVHVFHNATRAGTTVVDGGNFIGLTNKVILRDVRQGDYIDIAIDPAGGNPNDTNDHNDGTVCIAQIHSLASDGLSWNARSLGEREDFRATEAVVFDLLDRTPLLQAGRNVLAIHGLNSSAQDEDFLLEAELELSDRRLFEFPPRFFTHQTPGAENMISPSDASYLQILSLQKVNDQWTLSWDARPGNHYKVLFKPALHELDWVPLIELIAVGNVATYQINPPTPGFYIIELAH